MEPARLRTRLRKLGIGRGMYTAPEAARLSRITAPTVRRWFRGYNRSDHQYQPILQGDYADEAGLLLSFADLMEMSILNRFRRCGVSWKEIKAAADVAVRLLQSPHPFTTYRFRTDGKKLFAQIADEAGHEHLIQLAEGQHVFRNFIEPFLQELEYDNERLLRWYPLGCDRHVVVDPKRAFGGPIVAKSGVQTRVLAAQAQQASLDDVAQWYEVDLQEVRDALEFESRWAA